MKGLLTFQDGRSLPLSYGIFYFHNFVSCGVEGCGRIFGLFLSGGGCGRSADPTVEGKLPGITGLAEFSTASAAPAIYYEILNPSLSCGGGRKDASYEIFL